MLVENILQTKGRDVVLVRSMEGVVEASRLMAERDVGALIVSDDGRTPAGMLSERDVARAVAEHGAALAGLTVRELMSPDIITCEPQDTVDGLMATMTRSRVRHLPVMKDGALAGVVSIGDVVKHKLDAMELETEALRDYIVRG